MACCADAEQAGAGQVGALRRAALEQSAEGPRKPVLVPAEASNAMQEQPEARLARGMPIVREHFVLYDHILGDGCCAKVHLAWHKPSNCICALKRVETSNSQDKLSQVRREVSVLKRLEHRNIVAFFGNFAYGFEHALVLEALQGKDLFERLQLAKRLNECQCRDFMEQVFVAIAYMHTVGVCHRDLKAENLMFLREGPVEGNVLKVVDFGMAAEFNPLRLSRCFRDRVGTPWYVAPEIVNNLPYGPLVDEWSAGVVLYGSLSGEFPFSGDTQSVLQAVSAGEYSLNRPPWPSVSHAVRDLVKSLLDVNSNSRLCASDALLHPWLQKP